MADVAKRGVLFTLGVEADDSVQRVLGEMQARFSETAAGIRQSLSEAIHGAMQDAGGSPVDMRQWMEAARSAGREEEKVRQEAVNEAKAAQREQEKIQKEQEKAIAKREKEEIAAIQRIAKEERQRWEAEKKDREAAEKEAARARDRELKEAERQRKEIERHQRTAEAAVERSRGEALRMKTAFVEVGQGAIQAGRGLAMLGLVNKDTTDEIVRGLVKVQAAYDILKGGFEVWKKLTEGMDAYRKMVQAATAAETALASARKANIALGGISTPAPPTTATAAASAPAMLWGAAAAGVVAAGTSAVLTGREAMQNGIGGGARAGSLVDIVGSARWNPWAQAIGRGGFGIFGRDEFAAQDQAEETTRRRQAQREGLLGTIDRAREASARDVQVREIRDAGKQREDLWVQQDAVESARRAATAGLDTAYSQAQAGLFGRRPGMDATAEEVGKYAMDVRRTETTYRHAARETEATARRESVEATYQSAQAEVSGRQRQLDELRQREEALASGMIGGRRATGAEMAGGRLAEEQRKLAEELQAANEAAAEANQRMVDASKERLDAEREISAVRLEAAQQSIQMTKDEIALREALIAQETGKVRSAQEMLAGMNEEEFAKFQQQVQAVRGKQAAGQELSAEEFKFAKGLRQYDEFDDITRAAAETTGERRRAALGIAAEEQANVGRLGAEKRALEEQLAVQVKDERELRLTIQRDDDKLARQVGEEFKRAMEERDRRLLEQIRQEVEKAKEDLRRRQEDLFQANARGAK